MCCSVALKNDVYKKFWKTWEDAHIIVLNGEKQISDCIYNSMLDINSNYLLNIYYELVTYTRSLILTTLKCRGSYAHLATQATKAQRCSAGFPESLS